MACALPQAVTPPSVAFEIPIEKSHKHDSSPVQKRLAEYAHSPRKPLGLQDITDKLEEANRRRENIANENKSKISSHNAGVRKVHDKSIAREASESESLENRINSKLNKAGAKREDITANWVQRLSQTTKNKLFRGRKSLQDADIASRELQAKIDDKEMSAELRREEMYMHKVEELAAINDSKVRRAILVREISHLEAKHLENRIEQKLVLANHFREKKNILTSLRISEKEADAKEKAADARKREEEDAVKIAKLLNDRMKLAEERKENITAERAEKISAELNDKRLRRAISKMEEARRASEINEESFKRVEKAAKRRDKIIYEQQVALQQASAKKERLATVVQKEQDRAARLLQKNIQAKLLNSSSRKEAIIHSRVKKVKQINGKKKDDAISAFNKQLEESSKLDQRVNQQMKKVADRKDKIVKEIVSEMHDLNQCKLERIEQMNAKAKLDAAKKMAEIEKKISVASSNRTSVLANVVAKSSSKKRLMSPRPSPTKDEIEERIFAAAARREIFLNHRAENASHRAGKGSPREKMSPSRTNLFAALSPQRGCDEISPSRSPRIKAARLDGFSNVEEEACKQQRILFPLVAISGIAVMLVGLVSFYTRYRH